MNFPATKDGQLIDATPDSAVFALAGDLAVVQSAGDVLIWNPGPLDVWVLFGVPGVVATDKSLPVPARSIWAYSKWSSTHVAVVSPFGPQSIVVFLGEGA